MAGWASKIFRVMGAALRLRWPWYRWQYRERPWTYIRPQKDEEIDNIFHYATKVQLGDSKLAEFWCSNWLPGGPIATFAPRLFSYVRKTGISVAEGRQ